MNLKMKRWGLALTSALSALILATVMAAPAQANPDTILEERSLTAVATAPMVMDCSTLTEAGREYAVTNNVDLCGVLSGTETDGMVSPMGSGSATGLCGIATIEIYSTGGGNAQMIWCLQSSTGPILSYNVQVYYYGRSAAGAVPFSGVPLNPIAGDYTNQYTGPGPASAMLGGTVWTLFADCTILEPVAYDVI